MNWAKEKHNDLILKFGLFIINPIISFLYSCKKANTKSSFVVFTLFSMVLCLSITTPEIRDEDFNFDSIAYRFEFEDYVGESSSYFINNFNDYLSFTGKSDFYADFIYFVVSRFTGNYHIMFFVVGIVFTVFQLKSLKILMSNINYRNNKVTLIILFLFTINQIFNVNAFRFYTALWVATYSILSFFIEKKRVSILYLLFTPLIHGSFFVLVVFFFISLLLISYYKLILIIFISSFLISSVSVLFFNYILDFLPDSLYLKYFTYLSEDYMARINSEGTGFIWVTKGLEKIIHLTINAVSILLCLYKKNIKYSRSNSLFKFYIILLSFVNMTLIIPSLGSRFMILLMPIVAYILLDCLSTSKYYTKVVYLFGSVIFLLFNFPWGIYQFPCMSYYFRLIDNSFFVFSPIYTVVKNII